MDQDEFAELREELSALMPHRKVESIDEVDDHIEVFFKTGGHPIDIQEERQTKMLVFQILTKTAIVKVC